LNEAATAFWESYIAGLPAGHRHRTAPVSAFAFGDSAELATELAELVRSGRKMATASLPIELEANGTALPQPGDVSIVTLLDGTPVAIIETTEVALAPLGAVDEAFAAAEGEGDRTLAWWRAVHRAYFGRILARLGGDPLDDTTLVVCERFRLVHPGEATAEPVGERPDARGREGSTVMTDAAPVPRAIEVEALDEDGELQSYGVDVLPVDEGRVYKIVDIPAPLWCHEDLQFEDVIEVSPLGADTYRLLAVRQRGGWRRFDFLLSPEVVASQALRDALWRVEAADGLWVRGFGGCLCIVLPPGSTYDPTGDVCGPSG